MQHRKPFTDDLFAAAPPAECSAGESDVYNRLRGSRRARDRVNAMWHRYNELGLADPGFVKRFAIECTARLWEIHLAFVLDSWGWPLRPSNDRGAGPDFGVAMRRGSEERVMWFEATVPHAGIGDNQSDFVDIGNGLQGCFNGGGRAESLRILHAIREKVAQHEKWRQKDAVAQADGFVIAISGARFDPAASALVDRKKLPPVVRCLYGLDQETWIVPISGGPVRRGPRSLAATIEKRRNGASAMIESSLFTRPECPQVGGVLFCDNHLERRARDGSDFVLVHNPTADMHLPLDAMKRGREFFMRIGEVRH